MDTAELRDLRRSQLSKQLYENDIVLGHAGVTPEERAAVEAENLALLAKLGQDRPVRFGPQRPPEAYKPGPVSPWPYFKEEKLPSGLIYASRTDERPFRLSPERPLHVEVEFPAYWRGERIPTKSERIADLKKAYYNSPLNSPERAALKKRIEECGGSVE